MQVLALQQNPQRKVVRMADDNKPQAKQQAAPARGTIIRPPEALSAGDMSDAAINGAEALRAKQAEDERAEFAKALPQNVLDEMEAGRAALARHAPKSSE